MGSDRSRGPKPYMQRRMSTVFVRVPRAEWPAIVCGTKREFRAVCGKHSALWSVQTPSPAVAYTVSDIGVYESTLMVLEAVWREPLGATSAESLAEEGFASFAEFRSAWIRREKRRFPLVRMTTVYRRLVATQLQQRVSRRSWPMSFSCDRCGRGSDAPAAVHGWVAGFPWLVSWACGWKSFS